MDSITLISDCRYLSNDQCNIFFLLLIFFFSFICSRKCQFLRRSNLTQLQMTNVYLYYTLCILCILYTLVLYYCMLGFSSIRTMRNETKYIPICERQTFLFTHTSETKLHDSQIYAQCVLTRDS